ncbi:MAG: histidine kinase dimerization/phosphoacceptor domain -containing protein [Rhizomicrobium sp.]|jgi:chemotaxis protein methyltransferase CheR
MAICRFRFAACVPAIVLSLAEPFRKLINPVQTTFGARVYSWSKWGCQVAIREAPDHVEVGFIPTRRGVAELPPSRKVRAMSTMRKSSSGSESGIVDQGHLHIVPPNPAPSTGFDRRNDLAHTLMATVREPLVVFDRHFHIVAASRSFRRMFPNAPPDAHAAQFCEPNSFPWDNSTLELLQTVASQGVVIEDREIELGSPGIGRRKMLLSARQTTDESGSCAAIVVGLEDITAKHEADAFKAALQEKQDMLLTEVHHRVANSLQIIASILLLKARTVKSEETRLHLHDVHHRLISVATVQRQLSVTGPGNDVELGPYLKVLCEGLASSMIGDDQAVTIASSATAGAIKSEDAVSFGLIVTELVINSLKHGFPGGREGHIVVEYVKDGSDWHLSVVDDGAGRSPDPPEGHHVGLGTSIVDALARNLDARVEIARPDAGAATTIVHSAA